MTPKATQRSLGLLPWFQKGEPSPCFQQARWPLPKAMGAGPSWTWEAQPLPDKVSVAGSLLQWVQKVGLLPQWVWKAGLLCQWAWSTENWAKEDYSWALRSHGVCLVVWTYLGLIHPFFFPISPFWNENVYPMPVLPLYGGSTQLVWFHRLAHEE